jgi:DNA-binding response OmpR family regulator
LPFIFDRFYQVDTSSTRQYEGTGIGLALAKELVELHRGSIHAASAEGQGSTFTVRLPLGKDHLAPEEILEISEQLSVITDQSPVASDQQPATSDQQPATSDEQPDLILLVEDHAEMRRFVRNELAPAYRVLEAGDGEAGWEQALETIPDLVISDVMMPKMNGYELCRRLKTDERTSHIPVILLTAKADQPDKLAGLETGADDYLSKPFDRQELAARVKNLIALRRKLRERFARHVTLKPSEVAVESRDEAFLQRALAVMEEQIANEEFTAEDFQRAVGMSKTQLHRKLKALVNQAPREFMRAFRLQRAAQLLKQGAGNVTEIAYMVGFSSQPYFTKCFQEEFGVTPKEYAKRSAA